MYDRNTNQKIAINDKPTLYRLVNTIFFALLAGQILFAAVVVFAVSKGKMAFTIPPSSDPLLFVVPIMAVVSVVAGIFIFNQLLAKLNEKEDLPSRLQLYLSASIVRFALIEGVSLLGIVSGMLNNNLFYICISGLLVVYMISLRPTNYRIENDINFDLNSASVFDQQ